jgi:hypothetical protein
MLPTTRSLLAIGILWAFAAFAYPQAPPQIGPPDPTGIPGLQPWQWQIKAEGVAKMPLAGGLSTTDLTTFRMYYPATLKVDRTPHYHLGTEHVIVLKGIIHLGFGSCLEPEKALAYGPGSFVAIPAGTTHFEWFEGDVLVQVTSVGPMNAVKMPDGCTASTGK